MELTDLPNIGAELAKKLKQVGVNSAEELNAIGSEDALLKIDTLQNGGACINMLYALEGAVQGIRWHGLAKQRRAELKDFYNQIKKG